MIPLDHEDGGGDQPDNLVVEDHGIFNASDDDVLDNQIHVTAESFTLSENSIFHQCPARFPLTSKSMLRDVLIITLVNANYRSYNKPSQRALYFFNIFQDATAMIVSEVETNTVICVYD